MSQPRYTFRDYDFLTGKHRIRFTRGHFVQWTQPMGLANVPYAVFVTRSREILVPKYDVTPETLQQIGQP